MSFLSLTIWVIESQAIALPFVSVCLKDSLNFIIKSLKVPRERVAEAEVKASCWKVDAHVAADPLFMYERAKAICFSLVSSTGLLTMR